MSNTFLTGFTGKIKNPDNPVDPVKKWKQL
jgi:hypothetical protein